MKTFACGDIIPGCDAAVTAATEAEVHGWAAVHAVEGHASRPSPQMHAAVAAAMRTL